MSIEHTQQQSTDEQQESAALSRTQGRSPVSVPGYELRRLLGTGAYGEVWVAVDQTTGRQVAIKFYAHRGGLDWSLLSREVEKLAFLSADRYVVQLLDVGWDADPPYYVMEYVERGSLDDLLKRTGSLPASEAVTLFREVAIGLLHAHAKGVLHCDLKPANVLLDQDNKPRIADFGQSRLSHEQTPALGTLFYMAPEQADLKAVPDVRWDVYALGALLYAMLTGKPPYRSQAAITEMETAADLDDRLARYRELLAKSPPPIEHRSVPGVDRALAEIVDSCLTIDRTQRFANVQAVLDALDARSQRRARWPLLMLGAVGPAIALLLMSIFTWNAFQSVLEQSDHALRERVLESNRFAAQFAAKTVAYELDRRYRTLEFLAASKSFQDVLNELLTDSEITALREKLNDPATPDAERQIVRDEFLKNPKRLKLQERLKEVYVDEGRPTVGSWFVNDAQGLQLARMPESSTIGQNYGWRSYFWGGPDDKPSTWRPGPTDHVQKTQLSAVYRSASTNRWHVSITGPIYEGKNKDDFMGVLGLSVEAGRFVQLEPGEDQYSVLVDWRAGQHQGLVLQHPLFAEFMKTESKIPDQFYKIRLKAEELPDTPERRENYIDPFGNEEGGKAFDRWWLAEMAPVEGRDGNTGWLLIVQRRYTTAIGRTLGGLRASLWTNGLITLGVVVAVSIIMWTFVVRALNKPTGASLTTRTEERRHP
jgi:eukaryotic-like serine/threonine-protein kinase